MEHIKTTALRVSKLKKKAKLLVREGGIQHAEALDRAAAEAGYLHWKHVQVCAETEQRAGGATLATATALGLDPPLDSRVQRGERVQLTVVSGRSGTGKTVFALDSVLNALRSGKTATVLDVGRSYLRAINALGGCAFDVRSDGTIFQTALGAEELHLYDFEECRQEVSALSLESLRSRIEVRGSLLVVDEAWSIVRLFGHALDLVTSALERGCSVIVVGQGHDDMEPFCALELPKNTRRIHIEMKLPATKLREAQAA